MSSNTLIIFMARFRKIKKKRMSKITKKIKSTMRTSKMNRKTMPKIKKRTSKMKKKTMSKIKRR